MDYYDKYLKYKNKLHLIKSQFGFVKFNFDQSSGFFHKFNDSIDYYPKYLKYKTKYHLFKSHFNSNHKYVLNQNGGDVPIILSITFI